LEEEGRALSPERDEAPSGQPLLGMIDLQSWKKLWGRHLPLLSRRSVYLISPWHCREVVADEACSLDVTAAPEACVRGEHRMPSCAG